MWRRIPCASDPGSEQRLMDHCRHRALAVGAGDMNGLEACFWMVERRAERPNVVETELDADEFQCEETVEHGGRAACVRRAARWIPRRRDQRFRPQLRLRDP